MLSDPQPGIRATLRAIGAPHRITPVVVIAAALLWAQATYNDVPYRVALALALCVAFVAIAPVSWRMLFFSTTTRLHAMVLWAIYATIGVGTVSSLGYFVPRALRMQPTLMTEPRHLVVCVALFTIGGWQLGRHIALEARVEQLSSRAEQTQLLALRAQLDPHFLFNTLNAIAEWCILDGAVAEKALLQLSSMLRAILVGVRSSTWSLREELALVVALCEMHRLRDPSLFELHIDAVDQDARIPPMLLLGLVENAVKHGPNAGHRGTIAMHVRRSLHHLSIQISNPGPYRGPRAGSEGLPTLRRRLGLVYDDRARFSIGASATGTCATLELPL